MPVAPVNMIFSLCIFCLNNLYPRPLPLQKGSVDYPGRSPVTGVRGVPGTPHASSFIFIKGSSREQGSVKGEWEPVVHGQKSAGYGQSAGGRLAVTPALLSFALVVS